MSTQTITTSDISGEPGARTVILEIDGRRISVDATESELSAELQRTFWRAASPIRPTGEVPEMTPAQREAVRFWARREGLPVTGHGRITKTVMRAYTAAHPNEGIKLPW